MQCAYDTYYERSRRPVRWWEIAALEKPGAQVFGDLFVDCLGESVVLCRTLSLSMKVAESYDPVEPWQIVTVADLAETEGIWGHDGDVIAAWFAEGDVYAEPSLAADDELPTWFSQIPQYVGSLLGFL